MPRLLLLRHAKSAPGETGLPDFDRPLSPRGRRAANLVGEHLARHHLLPDRVLCSSSRRTRETLASMLGHLPGEVEIRLSRTLYEPRAGNYVETILRTGSLAATLLIIGHNPSMQETASLLTGFGSAELREEAEHRFPTAGLAVIDFEQSRWEDVVPRSGRIVAFFRPRDLELVGGLEGAVDEDG